MGYLTSDDFVREELNGKNNSSAFKMAKVTSIASDGSPYITFYGETSASKKSYKRLSSYTATVGDTVILGNVNGSFFILGKIV